MVHYAAMIRSHGITGGYNTEASEQLHIDFAKQAYQASNQKRYIQQMMKDEVDEVEDNVDVADGDEEVRAQAEINTKITKDTNGDQIASHVSLQHYAFPSLFYIRQLLEVLSSKVPKPVSKAVEGSKECQHWASAFSVPATLSARILPATCYFKSNLMYDALVSLKIINQALKGTSISITHYQHVNSPVLWDTSYTSDCNSPGGEEVGRRLAVQQISQQTETWKSCEQCRGCGTVEKNFVNGCCYNCQVLENDPVEQLHISQFQAQMQEEKWHQEINRVSHPPSLPLAPPPPYPSGAPVNPPLPSISLNSDGDVALCWKNNRLFQSGTEYGTLHNVYNKHIIQPNAVDFFRPDTMKKKAAAGITMHWELLIIVDKNPDGNYTWDASQDGTINYTYTSKGCLNCILVDTKLGTYMLQGFYAEAEKMGISLEEDCFLAKDIISSISGPVSPSPASGLSHLDYEHYKQDDPLFELIWLIKPLQVAQDQKWSTQLMFNSLNPSHKQMIMDLCCLQ
ncbi:hypothetical protein F5146DRAFT_1006567 [Armillaria mellea]|nr:hypothetical protein F5146DRAFT_1006567 [Armillaria mellea]